MIKIQMCLALLAVAGCKTNPTEPAYNPAIPSSWAAEVTNPLFPLPRGTVTTFESKGAEGNQTVRVEVLAQKTTVQGVAAIRVHDQVLAAGVLVEDTYDLYAQDSDGNVWYLGEDTKEYANGQVTGTAGTWTWGLNGALPGIIMHADPASHQGVAYRQEYLKGEAEDWAKVAATGQTVTVKFGTFNNCVAVEEWNAVKPNEAHDQKAYCPGVGFALKTRPGTSDREELVGRVSAVRMAAR